MTGKPGPVRLSPRMIAALRVIEHNDAYIEGHATEAGHGGIVHQATAVALENRGLAATYSVKQRVGEVWWVKITEAGRAALAHSGPARSE